MTDPIKSDVTVRLSRVSSNVASRDGKFVLRIEDNSSSQMVAEVELDDEAIANLVSTRAAEGVAELYIVSAERWGKQYRSETRFFDRHDYDFESTVREACELQQKANGYETYTLRKESRGWHARFMGWTDE